MAMAGKAGKPVYVDTLPALERSRYLDKLTLIDGIDPYDLAKAEWRSDVESFPAVTYPDIVNYFLFTPSVYTMDDLKAYKSMDAYNQFVCGWVREVGALVKNGHHIISGKVLHSQKLSEKPVSAWIVAEKTGKILAAHCNCTTGLGKACSHVAAILFWVEANVRIRDSKTVTQEKAYWMLPTSMKQVEYRPLGEIDFTSAKSKKLQLDAAMNDPSKLQNTKSPKPPRVAKKSCSTPATTAAELAELYEDISKCGINPAILSIIPPYSDSYIPKPLTPTFPRLLTDLYEPACAKMPFDKLLSHCEQINVEVTTEQAKNVEESTKGQANNKLWYKYRAGRITASRLHAVCHTNIASPSQSLVKAICYPEQPKFTSAATTWGSDHEKVVTEKYVQQMNEKHTDFRFSDSGLIINPVYPHLGASPDGIIKCDCCGTGCLEVKCPFNRRGQKLDDDVSCLEKTDCGVKLKTTHPYFYQVQCQMNLGGFEYADFVVWTELDMYVERVEVDCSFFSEKANLATQLFKVAILPELVGKFYSRPPLLSHPPQKVQPCQNCSTSVASLDSELEFEVWCFCQKGIDAELIRCDNENCPIQWFHLKCVGIKRTPKGKWYCPDCRTCLESRAGQPLYDNVLKTENLTECSAQYSGKKMELFSMHTASNFRLSNYILGHHFVIV